MAAISFRTGKRTKSRTAKPQLRRSIRLELNRKNAAFATDVAVLKSPLPTPGLVRLPIEVFHGVMEYLDVSSMLSLYHTCRNFRRKLHYELANYVWYKHLPPAVLRNEERGYGRLGRDFIWCLGGKYTNLFNYCNEVEHFVNEEYRCEICLHKDSSLTTLVVMWNRVLCETCAKPLGISRVDLKRLLFNHMSMGAFRRLRVEMPQKLLYRPSVDTIIRQHTGRGLSDFELVGKDEWRTSTQQLYQNDILRPKHDILRGRLIEATQHLYTYLTTICTVNGTISEDEAEKPFNLLCEQLQVSPEEVNNIMSSWFQSTQTLDSDIINIMHSRIGNNIVPFLFPRPFTRNVLQKEPQATVDAFIEDSFTRETLNCFFHEQEVPQELLIFDALRLLIRLFDVNAKSYNRSPLGGANPVLVEKMKRYHRHKIHAHLANGDIMNMSLWNAKPNVQNRHGLRTNRGITSLRKQLGLRPFPVCITDFVKLDPNDKTKFIFSSAATFECQSEAEKIAAVETAHERALAKEKEMLPYFNKICVEACNKCPVSGDNLPRPGLEAMLEHVRMSHKEVFWYGDIYLLA